MEVFMFANGFRQTPRDEGRRVASRNPENWQLILAERKASVTLAQIPRCNRLQAKYADLREQEQKEGNVLAARNDELAPSEKVALLFLSVAIAMFFGCWATAKFSLEPFWQGWTVYLGSLLIVGTTSGTVHLVHDGYRKKQWIKFSLNGTFLFLLLVVHFYLGQARAEIFKELVTDSSDIYARLLVYLKIALPLIGLIAEIVTGYLFNEAYEIWTHPVLIARRRLSRIREKMMAALEEYRYREVFPELFEKEFKAGALEALSTRTTSEVTIAKWIPIIVIGVIILLWFLQNFGHSETAVADQTKLVILLDLSKSRNGKGADEVSDFQKDAAAIAEIIRHLPANTELAVIGVSGNSFGSPYVLLQGKTPSEPGYFKEKIKKARDKLLRDWIDNSSKLKPTFETTDLFGALAVASQLKGKPPGRSILIIYSDMQQDDNGSFDFDKAKTILPDWVSKAEKQGLIAELRGVDVYCLGVTAGQKSLPYWNTLQGFWKEYFKKSRVDLKKFTISRDFQFEQQKVGR
jgi:hypothetical protein